MTADFTSNMSMMFALNNFTNGAYKYQYPTINGVTNAYMNPEIMSSIPSIFQQAAVMANAGNMGNYAHLTNFDVSNMSLSTPLWMQTISNQTYTPQVDFTRLYTYNPFAANNGSTTTVGSSQAGGVTNPFNQPSVKNQELANELNKYGISSTGDEEKDKKALEKAKAGETKVKKEAAKIAESLYDAMKGAGTKETKLATAIAAINKDNVVEVMEAWDSNFADAMGGETLLEAIQGEYHTGWFGNTQEKHESAILKALTDRAEDEKRGLGLSTEAAAARAKVNSEHSAMFTSDDTVKVSIENLAKQIKDKEFSMKAEKSQKAAQSNK